MTMEKDTTTISGVSRFMTYANGDILYVDALEVLDDTIGFSQGTYSITNMGYDFTALIAAAGSLYSATSVTSRTYLDVAGNPTYSITMDTDTTTISGVSRFMTDANGDIL